MCLSGYKYTTLMNACGCCFAEKTYLSQESKTYFKENVFLEAIEKYCEDTSIECMTTKNIV